jgi:glucose/mannose-6-phosphate isomerase
VSDDLRLILDDRAALASADPDGMLNRLAAFPELLRIARREGLPAAGWRPASPPARLIIGGMGGSAIAGDLLTGLLTAAGGAGALQPLRDYRLPALRGDDRLLLCSYSGNTEEILALHDEAKEAGLETLVLSSGGRLTELADERGLAAFSLPPGYPPRSAFPALLGRLLAISEGLGHHDAALEEMDGTLAELSALAADCAPERPCGENPAKDLALALGDHTALFCSMSPAYDSVARRLRCQMEENAERHALDRSLPELHHNSWVPWALGETPGLPIWLGEADAHPRVALRRRLSDELLPRTSLTIPARGASLLSRLLTTVLLGDYMSVYHALMRGLDPTPVTPLTEMKARLADFQEHS